MAEVYTCEMKKNVFDLLDKCPNWVAAWELCGKDAIAVFAGDSFIPVPHFHPKQAPCAPGYMVLRKNRELGEFLLHKQSQYVLTEYLWDFAPEYYGGQRSLLKTSSKYEDNKKQFEYKTSRTINGVTKTIKFTFNGQDVSTLDESPDRMVVDLDLFADEAYFDNETIYAVHSVVSANRGVFEVWIGDEYQRRIFAARTALGFQLIELQLEQLDDNERMVVESVKHVDSRKWKGTWLEKTIFGSGLARGLPNQHKYGGEAGDVVSGNSRLPFNLNNVYQ